MNMVALLAFAAILLYRKQPPNLLTTSILFYTHGMEDFLFHDGSEKLET